MKTHQNNCTAPLCEHDPQPQHIWLGGEEVCKSRPTSELQKRQKRINKAIKGGSDDLLNREFTRTSIEKSHL